MQDKIVVLVYQLNLIMKRMEKIIYEKVNYDIEQQLRKINEKIYEISDAVETIEIILEDDQINITGIN